MLEDEESIDSKYYLNTVQISNMPLKDIKDIKTDSLIQVGRLDNIKGIEQIKRVYSPEGICPTITTMGGGNREPKIATLKIPQIVKVRKYPVDTEKLIDVLRTAKSRQNLTNNKIASELCVPVTTVEHWFRNDSSFAIPEAEIWKALKELLRIDTTEFDMSITTFEERAGVYEKSNRYYLTEGISPTITSSSADEKIIIDNIYAAAMRGRYNSEGKTEQRLEISDREIANSITTVQKDSLIAIDGLRVRKLTARECWRLMSFSDEDFDKAVLTGMSTTQLYKQAGNSICVKVLEKIFKNLINNNKEEVHTS